MSLKIGDKIMKYSGLTALIKNDAQAKKYYDELPEYVREQIGQRKHHVNSFDSLRDYAENLLRGDT